MFKQETIYCQTQLAGHGIPEDLFPTITTGSALLSYMEPGLRLEVYLGIITQLLGQTKRSALHETIHVLFEHYPLTAEMRAAFGTPDEWNADQNMFAWLWEGNRYVTRYAATHPEEDTVETVITLLKKKRFPEHYHAKKNAIKAWLVSVKASNQAGEV